VPLIVPPVFPSNISRCAITLKSRGLRANPRPPEIMIENPYLMAYGEMR
jgi:hypothetical protein